MKPLILVAGIACGSLAWAQERSDLMPPEPQPAAGAQMYVPGMPLPVPATPAPASSGNGARGDKDKDKEEKKGLYLGDDNSGTFEADDNRGLGSEATPETHLVEKGDTLWDLSSRYYHNPYQWPKLWAYNPVITNPHWIYPGNLVRLLPAGANLPTVPVSNVVEPKHIQGGRGLRSGVFLRQTGFVEPGELKSAGKIIASKEEKLMLATLDEAYVECNKDNPLVVGQRYTVYRPTEKVVHPVTGQTLGQLVEIFGEAQVRSVSDRHIASIAIVDSLNPIERGFLVGPLKRQFKNVQPTPGHADLHGVIVATLHPRKLVGTEHVVFIDQGKSSGVEVGNRFFVTRRGDGYQPVLSSGPIDDHKFPVETVGEIIVVDTGDKVSTGLVVRSTRESRVGDRIESRSGM